MSDAAKIVPNDQRVETPDFNPIFQAWSKMSDEEFVASVHDARDEHPDWFNWTQFTNTMRLEIDLRLLRQQAELLRKTDG
jgi:hypothetical protein